MKAFGPTRRPALARLALLWALFLALPATAADRSATPAAQAVIHPLLVSPLSDAANPLWNRLQVQARRLAAPAPAARSPLDALAASVVARMAQDPEAAARLLLKDPDRTRAARLEGLLAELSKSPDGGPKSALQELARSSPAHRYIFDGNPAEASLELDGIAAGFEGLSLAKRPLETLGRGEFGAVYQHPGVPGAVIKEVNHCLEVLLRTDVTPAETADEEEATSRALARARAGPRYLGRAKIGARPVSVRERIFGETLQSLILDHRFGSQEHRMILGLLRRMAKAGLRTDDMRPPNIMIGTTRLNPKPHAYLVDGGKLLEPEPGLSPRERFRSLLNQDIKIRARWDPFVGAIVTYKPMRRILEDGLGQRTDKTRWEWFKRVLRELVENVSIPPPH